MAEWKGTIDTVTDIKLLDSNTVPNNLALYCNELNAWVIFFSSLLAGNSNDATAFDANDALGFWANLGVRPTSYSIFIPGAIANQQYTLLPEIPNDFTFSIASVYSGAATSYDIDIIEDGNPTTLTSDTGLGVGYQSLTDVIPYENTVSSGGRLYADITNAVGVTDLTIQVELRHYGIFIGN